MPEAGVDNQVTSITVLSLVIPPRHQQLHITFQSFNQQLHITFQSFNQQLHITFQSFNSKSSAKNMLVPGLSISWLEQEQVLNMKSTIFSEMIEVQVHEYCIQWHLLQ
jgi:hypothetical protein